MRLHKSIELFIISHITDYTPEYMFKVIELDNISIIYDFYLICHAVTKGVQGINIRYKVQFRISDNVYHVNSFIPNPIPDELHARLQLLKDKQQ